jgi:hypothetical protein
MNDTEKNEPNAGEVGVTSTVLLCRKCGGHGEIVAEDKWFENDVAVIFCDCAIGQIKASEQSSVIDDYFA